MMNRRTMFCMLAVLGLCYGAVHAQDWQSVLKGAITDVADEATGGKLTAMALVATWDYNKPGVRMEGSNALATLVASTTTASIEEKLESIYSMAGIKSGACSVTFASDSTFSMKAGSHTLSGTYTYNAESHAIAMTVTNEAQRALGTMEGYAYLDGSNMQLLFSANKVLELVQQVGDQVSSLSSLLATLKTLASNVENLYLGFEFTKA